MGEGVLSVLVPEHPFFKTIGPFAGVARIQKADWILMACAIQFYGDDSGSHGKGVFVLSGYLATEENWRSISNDWKAALDEDPKIPFFHMGPNYHGDKKPFKGWSEPDRLAKREKVLSVLSQYGTSVIEMSSIISWEDYNEGVTGTLREAFHNPYFFCFQGIVGMVKDWLIAHSRDECHVSYTFDRASALEAKLDDQFFRLRDQFPEFLSYLGGLCFEDDEYLPGLQVADCVAWLIRRNFVKPSQDNGVIRPELAKLRASYVNDPHLRIWRRDGLVEFCEKYRPGVK